MKGVIVTGDDFGYSKERNKGIVECFLNGVVTTISLLVNAIHCEDAVLQAKLFSIPFERIGLHLNLSEGKPLSQPEDVSSLLNEEGCFHGKHGFCEAVLHGKIKMEEVKIEMRRQINKYKQLTGRSPFYVDSHQHVHITGIRESFCEVLNEYRIKNIRQCGEIDMDKYTYIEESRRKFYVSKAQESEISKKVFEKYGIWFPDNFVGLSTTGADMSIDRLQAAILKAFENCEDNKGGNSVCEVMVHPGYPNELDGGCGNGPDDFSQSADRQHELNILMDSKFKQFFADCNLSLISYCDINKNI